MSPFGLETPCEEVVKACGDRVKGQTFLITGTSAKGLGATAAVALSKRLPTSCSSVETRPKWTP